MKKLLVSSIPVTLLASIGTMCIASGFDNVTETDPGYYIRTCRDYEPDTISIKFYDTSYAPKPDFLKPEEINDDFYYLVKYKETDTTVSLKYIPGSDLLQQSPSTEDAPLNV